MSEYLSQETTSNGILVEDDIDSFNDNHSPVCVLIRGLLQRAAAVLARDNLVTGRGHVFEVKTIKPAPQ